MDLTSETKRAMRAASQWKLGTTSWADMFIRIVEADSPVAAANIYMNGGLSATVDTVIPEVDPLTNLDGVHPI